MSWTKEQIHSMLDSKPQAVAKAILAIANRQTSTELATEQTVEKNGVGFSSNDAEFLTSLARFYRSRGFLTEPQIAKGRNKIKRYWRQLIEVANQSGKEPPITLQPIITAAVPEILPGLPLEKGGRTFTALYVCDSCAAGDVGCTGACAGHNKVEPDAIANSW